MPTKPITLAVILGLCLTLLVSCSHKTTEAKSSVVLPHLAVSTTSTAPVHHYAPGYTQEATCAFSVNICIPTNAAVTQRIRSPQIAPNGSGEYAPQVRLEDGSTCVWMLGVHDYLCSRPK